MIGVILMILGGVLWLTGELVNVFSHGETTTKFVHGIEKSLPWTRFLVGTFLLSLFVHLVWGGPLLP